MCHTVWTNDYKAFFAEHENTPAMGPFLLDQLVEPIRKFAITGASQLPHHLRRLVATRPNADMEGC